jgi:hypothetical protein
VRTSLQWLLDMYTFFACVVAVCLWICARLDLSQAMINMPQYIALQALMVYMHCVIIYVCSDLISARHSLAFCFSAPRAHALRGSNQMNQYKLGI